MFITALIALVVVFTAATLVVTLVDRPRRPRRGADRRNGGAPVMWDWPPRPINGHDHPEPPELEREPSA